jgi:hypothetical protein
MGGEIMDHCTDEIVSRIYHGEDKTITVDLGHHYNMTGATEIQAIFQKTDGTFLTKKLTDSPTAITVVDALEGKFTVALTDTETKLLLVGDVVLFEIKYDIGTATTIVQRNISVTAPLVA